MNYHKILLIIALICNSTGFHHLANFHDTVRNTVSSNLSIEIVEDDCFLDVKINNFELFKDLSSLIDIKMVIDCHPNCRLSFSNVDSSEQLTILVYPGSLAYHGSYFIVEQIKLENFDLIGTTSETKFVSGNGVTIGQDISTVRSLLHPLATTELSRNDTIIIEYTVNQDMCNLLCDKYNMPEYIGRYIFVEESLVRFEFGFSYP